MSQFRYKVLDSRGELVEGRMDAASDREVVLWLQGQGHMPVEVRPASDLQGGFRWKPSSRKPLPGTALVRLTQQLGTLLGSGQPLDRALTVLLDAPGEDERTLTLVRAIRNAVSEGSSLSTALSAQHGVFSDLYINIVRAGEAGGTLDESLKQLGEYLERSQALRDRVINALIYPAILLSIVGLSLLFLLGYVVPQFAAMYESLGAEVPILSSIVLSVGMFVRDWWPMVVAAPMLIALWLGRKLRTPEFRLRADAWLLRNRRLGALMIATQTARLARTLGTLLRNGVPLLTALGLGRNVMQNRVLAANVDHARMDVRNGSTLAAALRKAGGFPPLALQMIQVGEESGALDAVLLKVADIFEHETSTMLDRMIAMLIPAVTIALAAVVMLVILAVLTPIYDLTTVIG